MSHRQHQEAHGRKLAMLEFLPATIAELAEHTGLDRRTVQRYVQDLELAGHVHYYRGAGGRPGLVKEVAR